MDAERFGAFIAEQRKERHMTQAELAERLQVTDKAVSRWERGKGFPDIQLLVPLANALELSVVELMDAEKKDWETGESEFTDETVQNMMLQAAEMAGRNGDQDRTVTWIVGVTVLTATAAVKLSGYGNIGGGIVLGGMAALATAGIYLFAENKEDRSGRRIYSFFMILGIAMTTGLLERLGVDPSWIMRVLLWLLIAVVWIVNR
ncbi:MAG: helix-turn-helix transcriptional regulator [Eubacteriales bacterium]|nr:helix-turn-helix transcriptional regulator [Eubacteriales bacterium]